MFGYLILPLASSARMSGSQRNGSPAALSALLTSFKPLPVEMTVTVSSGEMRPPERLS